MTALRGSLDFPYMVRLLIDEVGGSWTVEMRIPCSRESLNERVQGNDVPFTRPHVLVGSAISLLV